MSNNYEWKRLADLPVDGVYLHCQQTINGYVYVYSGITKTGLMDDNFYKYSVELNSWEIIQPVGTKPEQRAGATSWVIDGKFYIYGGLGSSNKVLTDLWVYTPVSNSWNRLSDNVRHGTYAQSVVRNNKAIVFGGRTNLALQTDTLFVSEYNPINGLWTDLPHNTESRILNSVSIDKNNNILLYGGVRKENGTSYNGLDSVTVYKENNTTTSSSHSPGRYGQTCFYNDTTDKFYFFGGLDSSRNPLITDNFVEYDNINSWTEIPNSPIARIYSGVSSINEEFIITGGAIGTDDADNRTNEVWAYVKKEEEKPKGWKKLKNLPVKLDMHTQATVGDDIYVFGGRVDGIGPVDTLYKYNIPSDTWTQIPKSGTWPTVKYGHVMVSINEKLYVTGGHNRNNYDNTTWEFDPSSNQWTAKTAMPVLKYQAAAGVINDEMIVIGGSSGSASLQNTNYAYNPTNNTWRNYTPSQSFARLGPASAVVNDSLYLYGGSDASGAVQTFTLHVIENAIISKKEDHGPARWYHAGVKYKDNMYSLFGYTNQAQTIEAPCEEYNTLTETWTIVPDSPSKRRLTAASSVSNGFIVTGGSVVSGEFLDEVWFYGELEETPPEKEYTITWKKGADIPVTSLYYHASASVGNDVYVFGGRKNGGTRVNNTNDLWKYYTEDDTWELLTTPSPKPSPINGHMMVSINHLLYVIGGSDVNGQRSNETWEYNTLTNVWTQKQNFVNNSSNASAVIRNGKIVVVSSIASAPMTVEEYDPSVDTWSTIASFANSNYVQDTPFGLAIDNDNFIWICGGKKPSSATITVTNVITPDNQLVSMGSHPPQRDFNAATFHNGKFYTYGGGQYNVYSTTLNNSRFESFNRMTNEWENLSEDSPILRDIFGSTLSGNKFVVTGGRFLQSGSSVYTNETWIAEWEEKEEPKTYSWKRRPDIPVGGDAKQLRYSAGATIGNDYYVFGGRIVNTAGPAPYTNRLWKYNILSKVWTEITQPSLKPSERGNHTMVSLNGKLYVYGGYSGVSANGEMWEYTPEINTWVQKATGSNSINHSMFVKEGKIYTSGGNSQSSSSSNIDTLREYNQVTNTWSDVLSSNDIKRLDATASYNDIHNIIYGGLTYYPLNTGFEYDSSISVIPNSPSTGVIGAASGIIGDTFFVYGGNSSNNDHDVFMSYNITTKEWKPLDDSPPSRYAMAYANIPNGFIVSGAASYTLGLEVWEYSLDGDIPEPEYEWKRVADIPVNSLYGHGQAIIGDNVYVFGGIKNGFGWQFTTNELWKYSISTDTWDIVTQLSTKPSARAYHIMVTINDKIYVYGSGVNGNVGDLWEYTPSTNTWVSKQGSPTGYSYKSTGVVANNKLVVFNNTGDIMIYDPTTDSWNGIPSYAGLSPSRLGVGSDGNNILLYGNEHSSSSCYVLRNLSTIEKLDDHAPTRSNNSLFFLSNKFYTFGGWPDSISDNRFESYNLATNTWENLSDIAPSNRRDYGVAVNQTQSFVTGGVIGANAPTNETWIFISREEPEPEPEEWGYTEYTENTEVIVPENAESVYIVTVGAGAIGGGGLSHGKATVYPGETLWLEIDPVDTLNGTTSVYALRDGSKQLLMRALIASGVNGGKSWDGIPFSKLYGSYKGGDGIQYQSYSYFGGGAAGYYGDGNSGIGGSGKSGSSIAAGGNGNCDRNIKYICQGGGGVGLAGEGLSGTSGGQGGSNGTNGGMGTRESHTCWNLGTKTDYRSTGGNGGNYGGGAGSSTYRGVPGNGGISLLWTTEKLLSENINNAVVDVSFDDETDELVDYENKLNDSSIVASDYQYPEVIENNINIDVSDYETPVGIYGNSGKITQVVKEKSRGRKVNHSTVDVSDHGDLQIRTNEAYLVVSDEHEGFTNVYNKSIVTLSDKGELQIKSNYMWAEVSFNGIKYSKEFRLRETTPNTVTLSPIYDVEYEFIGIYPSDDTYDCEVFVNGVLQEKGEGKYFKLLLGDTIQFRITSPNPGEVKFVAINGDNILNIICPSKYGNYPDFLDFGEFTETFPNFWYETGELVIDGLYPLDSYSEIYVNNVRVWMVINDGEPTNRVNVTNGDRIKLVFKGSSPTELPEGETYKIYHDNDRGTYDVGQVVVKSIVVEGSETRQDIKFFIDMVILKTVTERQQLLLDSDYNHYQRTNHDSKNDFVLDSQHGIHDQDVSYIWDYTSIYENEVEYIWDKTSIYENTPNEYIFNITKILENIPNEYILDKTSIFESEEQSYDLNEYPSYIFDEYDTDVINSLRIPIGTDFDKNVSDIKFEIDTSGFIDNNKAQYDIDNEYDMHTQSIKYEIDNIYETVSGKDGNIHINAVEWIRNVEDISILIDQLHAYYDLGIHNLVDSVYENNTTISKIYIDAEYVHFTYNQYYFEGSYTHILQAVHVPIDAVYDTNQTERWPTEAQEWEVVKVQYPVYADMVYYHLVKYNPYHIIDTDFQIYIHTESTDVSSEYEEGTQHNNYKIDIVTDKGTSFVGYNFSGLYEKTEYNYHPVVTDKSLLVIGNSQTSVDGNDFEFVRDPVWQTDLIENLSGWHTREKAIEYAQSLNLSEEEIDLFEYEGRWGFTTDPELVVRDCSLPYPIIMIDKVIFWSH